MNRNNCLAIHVSEVHWIMRQFNIPENKYVPCSTEMLQYLMSRTRTFQRKYLNQHIWKEFIAICLLAQNNTPRSIETGFYMILEGKDNLNEKIATKISASSRTKKELITRINVCGWRYNENDPKISLVFLTIAQERLLEKIRTTQLPGFKKLT